MNKRTHIDVKVSVEGIRDSLRKMIVSNHSQLIADVIIGNLNQTECGMEQLFQAMSGIKDTPKLKVGDKVLVNQQHLNTWRFDKNKTLDKFGDNNEKIKAMIIEIDPYKKGCYKIKYNCVKSDGTELEDECGVWPNQVCTEEWPEGLGIEHEPDLPF